MSEPEGTSRTPPESRSPSKTWLYETIFEHPSTSGFVFDMGLLAAILLSILVVNLESVAAIETEHGAELRALEWLLTVLFTAEYVVRLYCHRHPKRHTRSFYGIVDVLAIPPTYIGAFFRGAQALTVVPTWIVSAEHVRAPLSPDLAGEVCSKCGHEHHARTARFRAGCGTSLHV